MEFDTSFWVQMIIYALSFGAVYGTISQQIKQLAAAVNKHNSVIERTFKVEESAKSAHKRLDEMHEEISALQNK